VYGGALTNSDASNFQALVLEDDDFWAIYGEDMDQSSTYMASFAARAHRQWLVYRESVKD
jgi:hypothetical protein